MNTKRKVSGFDVWLVGILLIAAFLRIFHLSWLTEFLGDQGRTMLVMKHFVEDGIIPFVGPLTQSGHNLGPIFYYLLFPGYVLTHSALGVSLWMAVLGVVSVYIVYLTGKRMFGTVSARYMSVLWAVSPVIISADRVIWEPNLVPLFSILFAYLLYRAYSEWKPIVWMFLGVVVGILIQLHYPNIYFVGLTGLCLLGTTVFRVRSIRDMLYASVWWLSGFMISMLPFLYYEYTVGFRDIIGVASIMGADGAPLGKRAMLAAILDYAYRVFGRFAPHMSRMPAAVLLFLSCVFVFFRPNKRNMFFLVWLVGGIIAMTRYKEVVHDHFLYFLVPVPFLLVGSYISSLRQHPWKLAVYGMLIFLCGYQLMQTDVLRDNHNDISRVSQTVGYIQSKTGSDPFSFTLIHGRSYSDLHYRYYMETFGMSPVSATSSGYTKLFIVCDSNECPTTQAITSMSEVPILCFEEHCKQYYPSIPLYKEWKYVRDEAIVSGSKELGRVYEFEQR